MSATFCSESWLPQVRKWSGKKIFFRVREKSGNFTSSQGKFKSLLFSNIQSSFVHFMDMNHVVLVEYFS